MRNVSLMLLLCCVVLIPMAAAETVGWRGDGSGRFPDADPPTEWSKDQNIVWKTEMPNWSNSSPIVVGGKLFVGCEPSDLICCDVNDGKILWRKSQDYFDTLSPEELPQAQETKKKAEELIAKLKPIEGQFNNCNGILGRLPDNRKKVDELPKQIAEQEQQVKTIQESFDKENAALANTPGNAELKKKVEEIKKQIEEAKKKLQNTQRDLERVKKELEETKDEAAYKAKVDDLKKQVEDLRNQIKPLNTHIRPETNPTNGYSSPTPVSDGKNVWCLATHGVIACYDLDGNRKWITILPKHGGGWGQCSSRVLCGDKLLVHLTDLCALNKDTGEVIWRTSGTPARYGTCAITKIKDVGIVITPNGDSVRLADGKLLARTPPKMDFNGPIIVHGVAYFFQDKGKAIKLPEEPADEIKPEELWTMKVKNDRYYGSPLYHDGIIYGITQQSVLSALDAKTGELIYEKTLDLKATVYPSLTLAGKYIYASGEGGVTAVFELGREFKEVKRNELGEGFRCCPLFVGNRMYIRGLKHLYCIGH